MLVHARIQRAGRAPPKRNASSKSPSIPPWVIKGRKGLVKAGMTVTDRRLSERATADCPAMLGDVVAFALCTLC